MITVGVLFLIILLIIILQTRGHIGANSHEVND